MYKVRSRAEVGRRNASALEGALLHLHAYSLHGQKLAGETFPFVEGVFLCMH